MYRHGIGVRKNVVEALVWYQKAAKQGSQRAQIALGIMYQSGIDMDIRFKDAAFWYMQVIGSTSQNGQEIARKVPYSVPQTNRDVALIYLEAARRGIISAQWGLGLLCNYGIGFEADQSLAMALQRLAEMNADQLDKPYIKANVAILRSSMTVETNRVADEWISKGLAKVLQQVDLSLRKTAMDYGR